MTTYVCTGSRDDVRPGCGRQVEGKPVVNAHYGKGRVLIMLVQHAGCGWRSAWLDEQPERNIEQLAGELAQRVNDGQVSFRTAVEDLVSYGNLTPAEASEKLRGYQKWPYQP